jgi:hypothetical protein
LKAFFTFLTSWIQLFHASALIVSSQIYTTAEAETQKIIDTCLEEPLMETEIQSTSETTLSLEETALGHHFLIH